MSKIEHIELKVDYTDVDQALDKINEVKTAAKELKKLIKELGDYSINITVSDDSKPPPQRGVTDKMLEAEQFVDRCLLANGEPPTYKQVTEALELKSTSAAYLRLRRYRHKMKSK